MPGTATLLPPPPVLPAALQPCTHALPLWPAAAVQHLPQRSPPHPVPPRRLGHSCTQHAHPAHAARCPHGACQLSGAAACRHRARHSRPPRRQHPQGAGWHALRAAHRRGHPAGVGCAVRRCASCSCLVARSMCQHVATGQHAPPVRTPLHALLRCRLSLLPTPGGPAGQPAPVPGLRAAALDFSPPVAGLPAAHISPLSVNERRHAFEAAAWHALSLGITTVHDLGRCQPPCPLLPSTAPTHAAVCVPPCTPRRWGRCGLSPDRQLSVRGTACPSAPPRPAPHA